MDDTIEETQRLVCETLGVDRSTLWQITGDGTEMAITHFWQPAGEIPLRRNFVTRGNLPWAEGMVRRGEPFHSTRPAGLGMGLAICRRIAESHNGRIVARNAATGGADFTLSLPTTPS